MNPHIVNMKFHKVTRVKYILKKKPVWLRHPLSTKSSCYNGGHILFQNIKPLGWLSIFIDIFVISAQKKINLTFKYNTNGVISYYKNQIE